MQAMAKIVGTVPSMQYSETVFMYRERLALAFYEGRSLAIRNKLIELSEPIARGVARTRSNGDADDRSDIFSYCVLNGVIPAAEEFSPERAATYSYFCTLKVRWSATEYFRSGKHQVITVPRVASDRIKRELVSNADCSVEPQTLPTHIVRNTQAAMACRNVLSYDAHGTFRGEDCMFTRDISELLCVDDTCVDDIARTILREKLDEIIGTLTPIQAQIVRLRYFEDMSLNEVAAATGHNENQVSNALYHALRALRRKRILIEELVN